MTDDEILARETELVLLDFAVNACRSVLDHGILDYPELNLAVRLLRRAAETERRVLLQAADGGRV